MKTKQVLTIILIGIGNICLGQQNPTNNNPVGVAANGTNSAQFWSRAGNTPNGGTNNLFGTLFNSPIYTTTNNIIRTRLNGTLTTPINTVNQVVDGYFGIGPNGYFATNSPWSMLHLQGPDNSGFGAGAGWRAWMKTEFIFTSSNDLI